MDIPYPSQHTMSGNHRPASEMPFKCFRCCIAKKKERKAGGREGVTGGGGGGLATNLRAPLKPIQFFWCFFACVFFTVCVCACVCVCGGGGYIVEIVCFIEKNPKGWHTCIYFSIKGLLIMYTWHLN